MLHQSSQEIIHFTNYVSHKDFATPELKRCVKKQALSSFSSSFFFFFFALSLSPDFSCLISGYLCVTVLRSGADQMMSGGETCQ